VIETKVRRIPEAPSPPGCFSYRVLRPLASTFAAPSAWLKDKIPWWGPVLRDARFVVHQVATRPVLPFRVVTLVGPGRVREI
jgi:hypothetical protein